MASPAPVRYALVGAGISALALALLQTLLAQRLERAQIAQMGPEVAFNLRLAELALDRLPPEALARLSGLPLRVGERPPVSADGRLLRQAEQLRRHLCRRLDPCPPVLPAAARVPGLWVEVLEEPGAGVPAPAERPPAFAEPGATGEHRAGPGLGQPPGSQALPLRIRRAHADCPPVRQPAGALGGALQGP